jgi:hypothetical protein
MNYGMDTTEYHSAMGQWQSNYLYYAAKGKLRLPQGETASFESRRKFFHWWISRMHP